MNPLELIDRAMWLANGQDDPHSGTIAELCEVLEVTLRHYAAAADALDFAHDEGFEWPTDPYGAPAFAFADMDGAAKRIAQAIRRAATTKIDAVADESAVAKGDAP
jgi:hypothetical protein